MSFPIQPPPPSSIKTTGYLVKVGPDIHYPTYEEVRHKLGDMLIRLTYDRYNKPLEKVNINYITFDLLNLVYPNACQRSRDGLSILNTTLWITDVSEVPTFQYIIVSKETKDGK